MTITSRFNPHARFDPYKQDRERQQHERGKETKIRVEMGARRKETRTRLEAELQGATLRKAPLTLPTVKFLKDQT